MELKLLNNIISPGDINRLIRQLENLEDQMVGASSRADNGTGVLQQTDPVLLQLAVANGLDMTSQEHRGHLKEGLGILLEQAPDLHISFTAEPSRASLEKIINWLRANIHPQTLMRVGLQPNLAAGCILRTTNHVFDLSLKQTLKKQQPLLLQIIKGARHE